MNKIGSIRKLLIGIAIASVMIIWSFPSMKRALYSTSVGSVLIFRSIIELGSVRHNTIRVIAQRDKKIFVTDVIENWGNQNDMETYDCDKHWSKYGPQRLCMKSLKNAGKIPMLRLSVSPLHQKSYIRVEIMTKDIGREAHAAFLNNIQNTLLEEFGRKFIELEP